MCHLAADCRKKRIIRKEEGVIVLTKRIGYAITPFMYGGKILSVLYFLNYFTNK